MSKEKDLINKLSNLETSEETQKYIKEMNAMEDNYEKRSTLAFAVIAIPILIVSIIMIKQAFVFTINLAKNNTEVEERQNIANSNTNTKTDTNTDTNTAKEESVTLPFNTNVYNFLSTKANRDKILKESISLNGGKDTGVSSIFIAQILRDNGLEISKSAINTKKLIAELEKNNWKQITDYKKLQKGDVCFTTSSSKTKAPTHTYIFMGWVKEGKTDYAYVCDSQTSEYKDTLHKRNLSVSTPKKDKFSFFMRK